MLIKWMWCRLTHHRYPDGWPRSVDVFGNPPGAWAHAAGGAVEMAGEREFEFGPDGKGAYIERFADAEARGKERRWGPEASGVAMEEDEKREDLQVGEAVEVVGRENRSR